MPPTRSSLLHLQRTGDRVALRRAVRGMRWRRVGNLWSRFGTWLGTFVTPVVLTVIYLTAFLPFGIIGRLVRRPRGWVGVAREPGGSIDNLRSPA